MAEPNKSFFWIVIELGVILWNGEEKNTKTGSVRIYKDTGRILCNCQKKQGRPRRKY